MSEAEILYQFTLFQDRTWETIQWWVSMSLGLVAVAHFGGKSLTKPLFILLLTLYISFTVFMATYVNISQERMLASLEDLAALPPDQLSFTSGTVLAGNTDSIIFSLSMTICLFGVFAGSIYFLYYTYKASRASI